MDSIRIGVLGTGNIADLNVGRLSRGPSLRGPRRVRRRAVVRRGRRAALGVPRVYNDIDKFLADPDIDAVEVLTRRTCTTRTSSPPWRRASTSRCKSPWPTPSKRPSRWQGPPRTPASPFASASAWPITRRSNWPSPRGPRRHRQADRAAHPHRRRPDGLVVPDGPQPRRLRWRLDDRSPGGHLFDDMVHKYAMALWLLEKDITSVQAVVRRRDLFFRAVRRHLRVRGPRVARTMEVQYAPHMWLRTSTTAPTNSSRSKAKRASCGSPGATGEMLDLAPVVALQRTRQGHHDHRVQRSRLELPHRLQAVVGHFIDALLNGMRRHSRPRRRSRCSAVLRPSTSPARRTKRSIPGS